MNNRQLGPYRIQSELGRGGMGIVYRAHDPSLQRFVALKTLTGTLAYDDGIKARFMREARSMAGIAHPNVVAVHSIGEDQNIPYFVMELVDGEPLSTLFKRQQRMSAADAARIIFQAANGLGAAHAKGVIHRDIKPGNLLLNRQGRVQVADFGIARSVLGDGEKLTMTGEFVGTPGYLSPEVCTGQTADARSDVFSLGVVLFECLTGRCPFVSDSPLALMLNVVQASLPDVKEINREVDDALLLVLYRMVNKNPEERYADGRAVAAALANHPAVVGGQPLSLVVRAAGTRPLQTAPAAPFSEEVKATRIGLGHKKGNDWTFPPERELYKKSWWPKILALVIAGAVGWYAAIHFSLIY